MSNKTIIKTNGKIRSVTVLLRTNNLWATIGASTYHASWDTLNLFAAEPFPIFSRNSVYVTITYSRQKVNEIFHLHIMST